jgi:hypothetical protein
MSRRRVTAIALAVGASSSWAMGVYHFLLPRLFDWDARATGMAPTIRWGMHSINFFFSFLLLAGGALTFVALRALRRGASPDRGILVVMICFWSLNTLYQILIPMPLPARLAALRLGLIGYAIVTVLAYAVALGTLKAKV